MQHVTQSLYPSSWPWLCGANSSRTPLTCAWLLTPTLRYPPHGQLRLPISVLVPQTCSSPYYPVPNTPLPPSDSPSNHQHQSTMAPSTSTATVEHIAVPETLLKKRRQNDKAREEKLAKATEARKVSCTVSIDVEGSQRMF